MLRGASAPAARLQTGNALRYARLPAGQTRSPRHAAAAPTAPPQCEFAQVGEVWASKFIAYRFNTRAQTDLIDDINA